MIRTRAAALLLATMASFGQAAGARAVAPAQMTASPCSVSGKVTLSAKLSCPFEPIRIDVKLKPTCPANLPNPVAVRAIYLSIRLPSAIHPLDPAPGNHPAHETPLQDAPLEWRIKLNTSQTPDDTVVVTRRIAPSKPGTFSIGDPAELTLEDTNGDHADGLLEPEPLTVAANCVRPRQSTLYLPYLVQPQCIPSPAPADIVLLLDQSGSVGNDGLAMAGQHARAFLDAIDLKRDRMAVISFDQAVHPLAPLGSTRPILEAALGRLVLAPGTRLDLAINAATDALARAPSPVKRRRVIVLVSDGVQTGADGDAPVLASAKAARGLGIAIFTVALGNTPDRRLLSAISSDPRLDRSAATAEELTGAYRELADVTGCSD